MVGGGSSEVGCCLTEGKAEASLGLNGAELRLWGGVWGKLTPLHSGPQTDVSSWWPVWPADGFHEEASPDWVYLTGGRCHPGPS